MSRILLTVLTCALCLVFFPGLIAAQEFEDSEQDGGGNIEVIVDVQVDDDWGWNGIWDWFVWERLESTLLDSVFQNEVSGPGGLTFIYRFRSHPEDPADAILEGYASAFLGSAFPGAGTLIDLISDIRIRQSLEIEGGLAEDIDE